MLNNMLRKERINKLLQQNSLRIASRDIAD